MELGLLSNEALNPHVNWTTLSQPLFRAMSERPNVQTIAPPPMRRDRLGDWKKIWSEARRCDTFFWFQSAARPEAPVHLASFLNPFARRAAYAFDPWRHRIQKVGLAATVQRLDPCFISYQEAINELKPRFPKAKFEWLPFGIDTDVFYPRPEGKSVFAFWMGRRHEPLHEALLAYCEARGLKYLYSNDGRYAPGDLGQVASSAEYFIVTPPDAKRSGGYSPLVMRYLEGLAAGARLLGTLPKSGEYERLLPLDAICQVAEDGSDLAAKLDADRNDPDRWRAVEAAGALVREAHSWRRRGEQIYDRLATGAPLVFPPPPSAGSVPGPTRDRITTA